MRPRSLASFIAGFKSATATRIDTLRDAAGTPVWQRNYYDHIILNRVIVNRVDFWPNDTLRLEEL